MPTVTIYGPDSKDPDILKRYKIQEQTGEHIIIDQVTGQPTGEVKPIYKYFDNVEHLTLSDFDAGALHAVKRRAFAGLASYEFKLVNPTPKK